MSDFCFSRDILVEHWLGCHAGHPEVGVAPEVNPGEYIVHTQLTKYYQFETKNQKKALVTPKRTCVGRKHSRQVFSVFFLKKKGQLKRS